MNLPVLQSLAALYRSRRAGRSASAARDLILPLKDLLKEAKCQHGPDRSGAMEVLETLAHEGILVLHRHPKDAAEILDVRLPLASEAAFFKRLGLPCPSEERQCLAELFKRAADFPVPSADEPGWRAFCKAKSEAALAGETIQPFTRANLEETCEILEALPPLLAWQGESLIRFASSLLFHDSKRLEKKLRAPLEICLKAITGGRIRTLSDLGIVETGRSLILHGPLRLVFENAGRSGISFDPSPRTLDLSLLAGPVRIASADLARARIETDAIRCLTVENASMLHELAKSRGNTILASSGSEGGFANSAVVQFLKALPEHMECWHFGDSDPKGFDILRDLRERVGRPIFALRMEFRASASAPGLTPADLQTIERLLDSPHLETSEKAELEKIKVSGSKGAFEQESFGRPLLEWPFYEILNF